MAKQERETRADVPLSNLDQPLYDGADATKRDLVDYLDGVRDRILPVLRGRPLSVQRLLRGQKPFMQKNVPKYTPSWVATTEVWAEASHRSISYALCDDRRTLVWFANQRAIEYHPALALAKTPGLATHLILDLDPPETEGDSDAGFAMAARAAALVRRTLAEAGLSGAVKTSGAKGLHIFVPLDHGDAVDDPWQRMADVAAATRALAARAERLDPELATTAFVRAERGGRVYLDPTRAGGATVVAAYSPRIRPGVPVSFPVGWDDLEQVTPRDFTIHSALRLLDGGDPWASAMPEPIRLPADLIEEGHTIPVPRVAAMHEGKRRARARRQAEHDSSGEPDASASD